MTQPHPKYHTVEECVKRMEEAFWRRHKSSAEFRAKLEGKTRVIQLALTDGQGHWFHILDGTLASVQHGTHARPDVVVTCSKHDLLAVFNGELKPMQAYLTGRVRVKASFGDLLFAKALMG